MTCTRCSRECLANQSHCEACLLGLRKTGADELPSGTSCTVGPHFFGGPRPGARFEIGTHSANTWRQAILAVSMFLMLGEILWVIWPVPMPDSRPVMVIYSFVKHLRADRTQAWHENTAPAQKFGRPAAPVSLGSLGGITIATQSLRAVKAQLAQQRTSAAHEKESPVKRRDLQGDVALATVSLRRATARGDPDAPINLANMYLTGDGVPRSCERAIALLFLAASKPNLRARSHLAAMYATGGCVQRDQVEAYRWLMLALVVKPSDPYALRNRELIWRQMTPEERNMVGLVR